MQILNIGCGTQTFGTHRLDIEPTSTTTHIADVKQGLPFPAETFDLVYERNIFEHLPDHYQHLQEIYRVLK